MMIRQIFNTYFMLLAVLLALPNLVFAGPNRTTYQAKIIKPDGLPLEAAAVNFRFTILDPTGSCVLYVENYSAINMQDSGGVISFALGAGSRSFPTSGTANTFLGIFDNATPSFSCQAPGNYIPTSSDSRKIVMQFQDSSGWQTLPAMSINAVPYAMYATTSNNSLTLNNKSDAAFVEYATLAGLSCASDQAIKFNGASFSCITVGGSGTTVTSSTITAALGFTPADNSTLSTVSSTVFSVSSTISTLNNTVTSLSNSVATSFSAITSSQWLTSGTQISYNSGFVGIGTLNPVTTLDVSGGLRIGIENATCTTGRAGTLRYNSGLVEYCNGTSWEAFGVSGAGILAINGLTSSTQTFAMGSAGTAPGVSSVGTVHTFNFPLASVGTTTAGLISNSDYSLFSTVISKITSSAASISEVLGYMPVSSSTLSNFLNKASNLSDLNSASAARDNLGLGGFATVSSLDLGSASATGILNDARLPSFANVTSGAQYTKVTVDSKGRVTSGAQLEFNDVTTALGYTPVSASASSQWNTSGTTINYLTGNVGIGTDTPAGKLHVKTNDNSAKMILDTPNSGGIVNDFLGAIEWHRGSSDRVSAKIQAVQEAVDGDIVGLAFFTHPGSGSEPPVEQLRLSKQGYLGIGTSAPAVLLHINGGSNSQIQMDRIDNNPNAANFLSRKARGTSATPLAILDGDDLLRMSGAGHDGTQFTNARAQMVFEASENWSTVSQGTQIRLSTTDIGSSSLAERLRISPNGNIGIGITDPTAKLHLASGTATVAPFKFTSGTLLASPQSGTMEYDGSQFYLTDSTNTRRSIATGSSANSIDNASTINSTGNITMVPTGSVVVSSSLGVAGNILSSGTIVTTSNIQGASITATNGISTNVIQGNMNLLLNPNGGNVGIGTSNPLSVLSISRNQSSATAVRVTNTDIAGNSQITLENNVTSAYLRFSGSSDTTSTDRYANRLVLGTNAGSSGISFRTDQGNYLFYNQGMSGSGYESLRLERGGSNGDSRLGIGVGYNATNSGDYYNYLPPYQLTLGAYSTVSERKIGVDRNVHPSIFGGHHLGIYAGGAASGSTNISGGDLNLNSGLSTGTGSSNINFKTVTPAASGSADNVATTKMTITGNGYVGVGTATPQSTFHIHDASNTTTRFRITNSTTTDAMARGLYLGQLSSDAYFWNNEPGDMVLATGGPSNMEKMRITSTGRIGMGTSNPAARLEVKGTDFLSSSIFATRVQENPSAGGFWSQKARGTVVSESAVLAEDSISNFGGLGHNGSAYGTGGYFAFVAENNWSVVNQATRMDLHLNQGSADGSTPTLMTVRSNGNVGIGATSPTARLHVASALDGFSAFKAQAGSSSLLEIALAGAAGSYSTSAAEGDVVIRNMNGTASESNGIVLSTAGASGVIKFGVGGVDGTERMRINSSGNVGIGTVNPNYTLDVNGAINATSVLVNGVAVGTGGTQWTSGGGGVISYTGGNVGIGTSTPNDKLEVSGAIKMGNVRSLNDTGDANRIVHTNANNNTSTNMMITPKGTASVALEVGLTDFVADRTNFEMLRILANPGAQNYKLLTAAGGTGQHRDIMINVSGTDVATFKTSGNVGIGTSSPSTILNVVGNGSYNNLLIESPNYTAVTARGGSSSGWPIFQLNHQGAGGKTWNIEAGRNASDSFGIYDTASAATRLSISSNGHVGIGTTAPTTRLQVASSNLSNGEHALVRYFDVNDSTKGLQYSYVSDGVSVTAGRLRTYGLIPFYLGTSSESSLLALVGSNVGIGTTTPAYKLDVNGAINATSVLVNGVAVGAGGTQWASASGGAISYTGGNVGLGVSSPLGKLHIDQGDSGVPSILGTLNAPSNQNIMFLKQLNAGGDGSANSALIRIDNRGSNPTFYSSNNGANPFIITSSGSVGIGTTTPNQKLVVGNDMGVISANNAIAIGVTGTGNTQLFMGNDSNNFGNLFWNGTNRSLTLRTKSNGTVNSNQFVLSASGSVGIGTDSPSADVPWPSPALDISGARGTAIIRTTNVNGLSTLRMVGPSSGSDFHINFSDNSGGLTFGPQQGSLTAMNIAKSGNVGIGAAATTAKLHINDGGSGVSATELLSLQTSYAPNSAKKSLTWRDGTSVTASIDTRFNGATVDMVFGSLYNSAYSTADILTIKGTGNVGIGTTNPGSNLTLGSSIVTQNTTGADRLYSKIGAQTNESNFSVGSIRFIQPDTHFQDAGAIAFYSAYGTEAERMRITPLGNIGIGTTNPQVGLMVEKNDGSGFASWFRASAASAGVGIGTHTTAAGKVQGLNAGGGVGDLVLNPTGGNVGVGIANPVFNFHVNTVSDSGFRVSRTGLSGSIKAGIADSGGEGINTVSVDDAFMYNDGGAFALGTAGVHSLKLGTSGIERMRIDSAGLVGIGNTGPTERLHVTGNLRVQGSTDCTLGNGAGGTNCSSDSRLKNNITPIENSLNKILSLRGVEFDWNSKSQSVGRHDIGVIAQDVEKVFPTAVITDHSSGYKKVDYAVLVAPLIQAIKELYAYVNSFKADTNDQIRSISSVVENKADKSVIEALQKENLEKQKELDAMKLYLCQKDKDAPFCK